MLNNTNFRLLFQRLYNWVKYKTLPPSLLFKNRLFIEKDNKNKRITANWGASFRNTKWSNYATSNIKFSFKKNYVRLFINLALFCIFFVLAHGFWGYYMVNPTYNTFVAFFWFGGEVLDYYVAYLFWCICSIFSMTVNFVYSYFFFNNFSTRASTISKSEINPFTKKFPQYPNIEKNDSNWALTSFLNSTGTRFDKMMESSFAENLFENILNFKKWNSTLDSYIILFKSTRAFNFVSAAKSAVFSNNYLRKLLELERRTNADLARFEMMKNSIRFASKWCKKNSPIIKKNSTFFFANLKTKKKWDWDDFKNNCLKLKFLTDSKIGAFFLSKLTHGGLSNRTNSTRDFNAVQSCFTEQIKTIKISRWVYRYSILGRKILKNSHKITMSKKILNFNFFSKNDFNKNLWVSQQGCKLLEANSQNFNLFYNSPYNEVLVFENKKNTRNNPLLLEDFSISRQSSLNLKFYETSFHWLLKRSYFLNGVRASRAKSQKINFKNKALNQSNNLFVTKLLNDNYFLSQWSPALFNNGDYLIDSTTNCEINLSVKNTTDLFLGHHELTLYNQDSTNSLAYIFNETNENQNVFLFFANLNILTEQNAVFSVFLTKKLTQNDLYFFNETVFLFHKGGSLNSRDAFDLLLLEQ